MLLIRLIRYIKGYILFSVQGTFIERFLNMAARSGIAIWDGQKKKDTYHGYTLAKNYKRFHSLARKTGVRTRVEKRKGLPFLKKKYRKRWGLFIGAVVFCVIIGFFSLFIWNIRVEGNVNVSTKEILQSLDNMGFHKGVWKHSVDTKDLEEKLLLSVDELSWAAINLKGSTATVEVKERVMPPQAMDTKEPYNVIAKRAGQIQYMEVYSGQAVVTKGDTVAKGDVIVSGIMTDKNSVKSFNRHARAKILAQVEESVTIEVPLKQTVTVSTNEVVHHRSVNILGLNVPVTFGKNLPETYSRDEYEKSMSIFGFDLPGTVYTEQIVPLEKREITLTEEKARELAMMDLDRFEKKLAAYGKILDKSANGSLKDGVFMIEANYVCLQDIAEEQKILIN